MLSLAKSVGFGITGIMLYMFTTEALKQYAVLKAMGATSRLLLAMIFVQAGQCALLGTGLGLGLCAIIGQIAVEAAYPFRMTFRRQNAERIGKRGIKQRSRRVPRQGLRCSRNLDKVVIDQQLIAHDQWARRRVKMRLIWPLIGLQKRCFELTFCSSGIDNYRIRRAEHRR